MLQLNQGLALAENCLRGVSKGFKLLGNLRHLIILDSRRLWLHWSLFGIDDSHSETQLELGLGSAVELLVDRGVVGVESDEGSGTITVAFEDGLGGRKNTEKASKLFVLSVSCSKA